MIGTHEVEPLRPSCCFAQEGNNNKRKLRRWIGLYLVSISSPPKSKQSRSTSRCIRTKERNKSSRKSAFGTPTDINLKTKLSIILHVDKSRIAGAD